MRFIRLLFKRTRFFIFNIFDTAQKKAIGDKNIKMRKPKKFKHIINYVEDINMQSKHHKEPDYIASRKRDMTISPYETFNIFSACQKPSQFYLRVRSIIAKAVSEKYMGEYSEKAAEENKDDIIWNRRQQEIKMLREIMNEKFTISNASGENVTFYDDSKLFNFCVDIANKTKKTLWAGILGQNVLLSEIILLLEEVAEGKVNFYTNTVHIIKYQFNQINTLEQENSDLLSGEKVLQLQKTIGNRDNEIEEKKRKIKHRDHKIKRLNSEIAGQKKHYEEKIEEQAGIIKDQEGIIEEQAAEIDDLKDEIRVLRNDVSDLSSRMQSQEDRFSETLKRLDSKIDSVVEENKRLFLTVEEESKKTKSSSHLRHSFFWSVGQEKVEKQSAMMACPINHDTFFNPVVAEDNEVYEKEAIEKFFKKTSGNKVVSPMTKEVIGKTLRPVRLVRELAEDFRGNPTNSSGKTRFAGTN